MPTGQVSPKAPDTQRRYPLLEVVMKSEHGSTTALSTTLAATPTATLATPLAPTRVTTAPHVLGRGAPDGVPRQGQLSYPAQTSHSAYSPYSPRPPCLLEAGASVRSEDFERRQVDAYTGEDVDLLVALANVAAVAIQNVQLLRQIQQELTERKRAAGPINGTSIPAKRSGPRSQDRIAVHPVATGQTADSWQV